MITLDNRSVGGIIERGGTFLGSGRSEEFKTTQGQRKAIDQAHSAGLDGLIVIGGNGSLTGARLLQESGLPSVGIPASIDNDIYGSVMAIGVDTALNTVVESLDRLRDTAISHNRVFVVEAMGRESGYIALMGGLAGGAELVLVPEFPISFKQVSDNVLAGLEKGKHHSIIIVAEGFRPVDGKTGHESVSRDVSEYLKETCKVETRLTILGHVQRGGSPSAFDRILGSRLGDAAVKLFADGKSGMMVALNGNKIESFPLDNIDIPSENFNRDIYRLAYQIAN
jgi:6-phosphofructokinase 1